MLSDENELQIETDLVWKLKAVKMVLVDGRKPIDLEAMVDETWRIGLLRHSVKRSCDHEKYDVMCQYPVA